MFLDLETTDYHIINDNLKPVFHGACFEVDSVPILSAPYTRQARPYPARIKSAPNPLQNTLHGKRALLNHM